MDDRSGSKSSLFSPGSPSCSSVNNLPCQLEECVSVLTSFLSSSCFFFSPQSYWKNRSEYRARCQSKLPAFSKDFSTRYKEIKQARIRVCPCWALQYSTSVSLVPLPPSSISFSIHLPHTLWCYHTYLMRTLRSDVWEPSILIATFKLSSAKTI